MVIVRHLEVTNDVGTIHRYAPSRADRSGQMRAGLVFRFVERARRPGVALVLDADRARGLRLDAGLVQQSGIPSQRASGRFDLLAMGRTDGSYPRHWSLPG